MILSLFNEWYIVTPVLGVVVVAVLIFSYGFKQVSDPPLNYLLIDDKRVGADKKKREKLKVKPKEKKPVQNGQVTPSEQTEKPVVKPKPPVEKNNNTAAVKNAKVEAAKKVADQKVKKAPEVDTVSGDSQDAVDGNWIQVPSRLDKKQKRKTGTPELTDVSSAESTPAHQPKVVEVPEKNAATVVEQEAIPEEPKPAEVETVAAEVAKQAQNGEVLRAKEGKKSGSAKPASKPSKAKQEAKQGAPRAPLIVVDPVPVEREPSPAPAPKKAGPAPQAKTERIPQAVAPVATEEPTAPLTNGEIKPSTAASSSGVQQPPVVETNVAFDELGDVWQETRAQKKKKKARRD